jgi:hypothetical protein
MTAMAAVRDLLACPLCRTAIQAEIGQPATCRSCQAVYPALGATWDLIPYAVVSLNPVWGPWLQTQDNGSAGYTGDPTANLSLGDREDCLAFSRFCAFDGSVLDVGCGPQHWPSYFNVRSPRASFVGVDPLIGDTSPDYPQVRALGEYLPFTDSVFRHVVFATSADHLIQPAVALSEAARVLVHGGEIDMWVGEKDPGTPPPSTSPEWYTRLRKPEGAEDFFHLKRLTRDDVQRLADAANLTIVEEQVLRVNEYRRNCFIRLRPSLS